MRRRFGLASVFLILASVSLSAKATTIYSTASAADSSLDGGVDSFAASVLNPAGIISDGKQLKGTSWSITGAAISLNFAARIAPYADLAASGISTSGPAATRTPATFPRSTSFGLGPGMSGVTMQNVDYQSDYSSSIPPIVLF